MKKRKQMQSLPFEFFLLTLLTCEKKNTLNMLRFVCEKDENSKLQSTLKICFLLDESSKKKGR
jgi:hypothetical protein